MSELSSSSDSSSDEYNSEKILTGWLEAVMNLHQHYRDIYNCVTESSVQRKETTEGTIYIGQCPVKQLEMLLITIQGEVDKLRQDIDQLTLLRQIEIKINYTKLVSHTSTLNYLNNQAKIRLHLASLPAS